MNVNLTPELEELVRLKVQTGRYRSVSDVVGEALRLLGEHDRAQSVFIDDTREKIAAGLKSLRAGQGVDGDAFLAAMDAELGRLEGGAKA